jgi:hypothetical protein
LGSRQHVLACSTLKAAKLTAVEMWIERDINVLGSAKETWILSYRENTRRIR